jgi:tetratricopeptide (TPR) repeat protein
MSRWTSLAIWKSLSRSLRRFKFDGGAPLRWIKQTLRPFREMLAGLVKYLFVRREWRYLGYGLPAVLVTALVIVVHLVRQQSSVQDRILSGYMSRGQKSLTAGEYRSALMWHEHAMQLQPTNTDVRLAYIKTLAAAGELNAALGQFDQLSRSSDTVISTRSAVSAAELILQNLTEFSDGRLNDPPLLVAEQYIRIAMKWHPENPQYNVLLAEVLVERGHPTEALQHLNTIAEQHREQYVTMSDIAFVAGMVQLSKDYASRAASFLADSLQKAPANIPLRCMLARMQQRQGDYTLASQTLGQGVENADDNEKELLSEILVVVTIAEYDAIAYSNYDPNTVARQVALLELMLKIKQGDLKVDARLCHFIGAHKDDGQRFEDDLQRALTRSDSAQFLHLILGTYYAESGQIQEALFHLETASKTGVRSAVLLNNLAWVMIATKPEEMDQALQMVNIAIEMSPDDPGFLSTRGEIYFRMEKWDDARQDIEMSINRLPANDELREKLAVAYDRLGNPDMASKHRELIKRISSGTKFEP